MAEEEEPELSLQEVPGVSFQDTPFAHYSKENHVGRTDSFPKEEGEDGKGKEQDVEGHLDPPLNSEDPEESDGVEKELQADDEDVVQEMAKDAEQSLLLQEGEGGRKQGALDETKHPNYRKYANEEPSDTNWRTHNKHIFVLSNAGKPIFSRYGDESKLSSVMGVLSAIISFAESESDIIHEILAGQHKFIFLQKGPLYLVSVSKTSEPSKDLLLHLEYVHSQIIFLLTAGVNRIFEARADFDLRNLLSGTEKMFDNLVSFMDHDASVFTDSIHCLPLNEGVRKSIGKILLESRSPSVLYGMIISKHQMVNLIRPRKHPLFPSDLHLILNFINSGASFRSNETWTPICLPKFNEKGFLHSYIRFIAEDVCLLLISTKGDSFYELSECGRKIVSALEISGCLKDVVTATKASTYLPSDTGNADILHFIYISTVTSQLTQPTMTAPYTHRKNKKRLFRLYQHLHNRSDNNQLYYHSSKFETFVLYAAFGPLEQKSTVIRSCNHLLRWIKAEEGRLFILNSPVF